MRNRAFDCRAPCWAKCLGIMLLLPIIAGCGPGRGKVSGQVLLSGAPLPGGRVTFLPADPRQNSVSAELDDLGNYEATLPVGEVNVCVDNRELEPPVVLSGGLPPGLPSQVEKAIGGKPQQTPPKAVEKPAKDAPGRYVEIPEKYYAIETSELQFKVEGGDQKHNIELTK